MIPLHRRSSLLVLAVIASLWGCGGDDSPSDPNDPDPNPTDDGVMTARIDDVEWTGSFQLRGRATSKVPGGYEVRASNGSTLIQIDLFYVEETGTYPLGVTATVFGGYAALSNTSGALWHSAVTGSSGSVALTTLSATRIAGTFQFQATPFPGTQATGTKVVTDGHFDFPLSEPGTSVPDNAGGKLNATLNDVEYIASYVAVTGQGTSDLIFSTSNADFTVTFFLNEVEGPGEYPLSFVTPTRAMVINAGNQAPAGDNCCWGPSLADSGAVTITSYSADRIVGTFEGTIEARPGTPATAPLVITDGAFDLGLAIP